MPRTPNGAAGFEPAFFIYESSVKALAGVVGYGAFF
jgi:hypothetical protein